ncbi:hypothetical protein N665_2102s0003 [Sinapis alba]|nr:hypothetical protein N665_2102s0003 [Sinapis alba]
MLVNRELSPIELLPRDIHVIILARVARSSETDLRNAMASTPTLGLAAADLRVYKNLDLQMHTISPLASINHFRSLMDRCLASGNVQAHYVRGIQEYFHNTDTVTGIYHLRVSAEGSYADAVYLYGMIMLCSGARDVGHAYIDMLGWRDSPVKVDECWGRIKTSLHGIVVTRLPVYMTTYKETRRGITCHRNNIGRRCEQCFYFRQMQKFVYMI